jgi:hypothetical protein
LNAREVLNNCQSWKHSSPKKAANILNLLEQIESVNQMIKLHQHDPFMRKQYQYRKDQFVRELAEGLKDFEVLPQDLAA